MQDAENEETDCSRILPDLVNSSARWNEEATRTQPSVGGDMVANTILTLSTFKLSEAESRQNDSTTEMPAGPQPSSSEGKNDFEEATHTRPSVGRDIMVNTILMLKTFESMKARLRLADSATETPARFQPSSPDGKAGDKSKVKVENEQTTCEYDE